MRYVSEMKQKAVVSRILSHAYVAGMPFAMAFAEPAPLRHALLITLNGGDHHRVGQRTPDAAQHPLARADARHEVTGDEP